MQKGLEPWQSLVAGLGAGGIEGFLTYPAEMVKTASQFSAKAGKPVSPMLIVSATLREKGISGFYSGCSALVVGNSAKAGVRFLTYDSIKGILRDSSTGKLSTANSVVAGMLAGAAEAAIAVTPSETIKTKLIDDSRKVQPRFQGAVHGVSLILKEEGLVGIYRGLMPTILKQSANSAVRFTSYNALVNAMQGFTKTGGSLSHVQTFICGAGAGIITVYSTMPLDVIKTRMQSLEASRYRNSLSCLTYIVKEDGVAALWRGSTARLSRLVFSGGIVFVAYEQFAKWFRAFNGV